MSKNTVPVRPASRDAVYAIVDGERDYQNGGEGNAAPSTELRAKGVHANPLSFGEGLLCLEEILRKARAEWYFPDGTPKALPYVRKAAGVAIQLLENFGAPPRAEHDPNLPNSAE